MQGINKGKWTRGDNSHTMISYKGKATLLERLLDYDPETEQDRKTISSRWKHGSRRMGMGRSYLDKNTQIRSQEIKTKIKNKSFSSFFKIRNKHTRTLPQTLTCSTLNLSYHPALNRTNKINHFSHSHFKPIFFQNLQGHGPKPLFFNQNQKTRQDLTLRLTERTCFCSLSPLI